LTGWISRQMEKNGRIWHYVASIGLVFDKAETTYIKENNE
jgi:hypothetical protein